MNMRRAAIITVVIAGLGLIPPGLAQIPPAAKTTFDQDQHPPAPDYAQSSSWAALPGIASAADEVPVGDPHPSAGLDAPVDVFYIHPTTFHSQAHWNQTVDDRETNDWTDISVLARQASPFNGCCRIYAPRYRQAATGAVESTDGSGDKAFNLAYGDVRRAFELYLTHYNKGRPFILVGHSQGTLHIYRLILELIDGKPLQQRFIAAYAPGVGISLGEFGRTYRYVTACSTPTQLQCIASWNSFSIAGDPSAYREQQERKFASKFGEEGKQILCVNPLSFDLSKPGAPTSANLGALPGAPSHDALPALIPGAVSATCVDGVLMVQPPADPAFVVRLLPKGFLHYHDIDFYYENIRANAIVRAAAYLSNKRSARGTSHLPSSGRQ